MAVRRQDGREHTQDAQHFGERRQDGLVEPFVTCRLQKELHIWQDLAPVAEVGGGPLAFVLQGARFGYAFR